MASAELDGTAVPAVSQSDVLANSPDVAPKVDVKPGAAIGESEGGVVTAGLVVPKDGGQSENGGQSEKEEAGEASNSTKDTVKSRPKVRAKRLPIEILQKILYQVDSETFASVTLVDTNWRKATEDAKLYAYHLSRSPIYSRQHSIISELPEETRLPEIKRQFVQESKRCLYTSFLQPRITTVNLISETPLSSFAAGPGGEKFDFTFSTYGRWCLAISSSRIYVIDLTGQTGLNKQGQGAKAEATAGNEGTEAGKVPEESSTDVKGKGVATHPQPPRRSVIEVVKELKVVRRPLAADILADGSVLAVLSSDHKVSLYNIKGDSVELRRTVDLDNPPYTISMSPGGEILAAAFDGGMELCSLREEASQSERRTVKSHRVDRLMFSSDGSMLLGTTQTKDPATVILSAPYFNAMEHDLTQAELVNSMWTQQILFPSSSRDCSHSTLLPRYGDDDANWTLTYDRVYESFRAVRTDDLRNGTTYFTGPQGSDRRIQWPKDALIPSSLPSATSKGDLVAAGFKGSEIWLYGVPENLDATANAQGLADQMIAATNAGGTIVDGEDTATTPTGGESKRPRWQMLVDKYRNVFSKGKKVADVAGVSAMCWYKPADDPTASKSHRISERLIIAAPGGVGSEFILDEETPIEGGRLVVLDFDMAPHNGESEEVTVELGKVDPVLLEEQKTDMEAEIAKARRRTLAQRDTARVRSVIDALRPNNGLEDTPEVPEVPGSMTFGPEPPRGNTDTNDVSDDDEPGVSVEEAAAFAEGPYSHANPRSRAALYRSATVSAATRQRQPQNRYRDEAQNMPMRRTDGTEVPDESDADNWVMPPPPYQRHAGEQLPDDLVQRALMYNGIAPIPSVVDSLVRPRRSSSVNIDLRSHRRRSSVDTDLLTQHLRPSRPGDEFYRGGDQTAVSSTNVTPRSSIRRRPLTQYTSSSSMALRDGNLSPRDSNLALRDSSVARPVSHLTRSSSLNSASHRLSRSESLRRSSLAPTTPVQSAPQPTLYEQQDWPLPVPQEQPEPISPPDEAGDPIAVTRPPQEPSPLQPEILPMPPRAMEDDLGQPSPSSGPLQILPEDKIPTPGEDHAISPRATAPLNQPTAPWVDTPPQTESPSEPPLTALPEVPAPPSIAPIVSQAIAGQPPGPSMSTTTSPVSPRSQTSNAPQIPSPVEQTQPAPLAIPELSSTAVPLSTQNAVAQVQSGTPTSPNHTSTAVPEPSAYQLANMQNRQRPHARQLSGSLHQTQPLNSPTPTTYTAYSQSVRSAMQASAPRQDSSDRIDTASIKSRKRRNRLSQRLRGAFRRADPDEPMPELPIIPGVYTSSNGAQPSPSQASPGFPSQPPFGPARHSRLYADNRNNASEPALRRPQPQRLNTIQSVATPVPRAPSATDHYPAQTAAVASTLGDLPEGRRPKAKRSRSIFGGRRRSQVNTNVVANNDMPAVPAIPASYAHGDRADSVPMADPRPGRIHRAATAEPAGYFAQGVGEFQTGYDERPRADTAMGMHTEITGGKKGKWKGRDKEGKCRVM